MRCQCCNKNLSDYESVLKHPVTLEYLDICTRCLKDIPIEPLEPDNMVDDTGYDNGDDIELEIQFNQDDEDY